MPTPRIAIVGGGLSGLYAAYLLEQRGIRDYVLFEARETPGGRIASVGSPAPSSGGTAGRSDSVDRFDLGATWFWPEVQPQLDALVRELGLRTVEQPATGDMNVERSRDDAPVRMRGYANYPASMRLVGGMSALVDALAGQLDPARVLTGETVRRLRCTEAGIDVDSEDATGRAMTTPVTHVLLAVPPRIAEQCIGFAPALPAPLARQWRDTATWMAPHAKYVARYRTPFWREHGLSGEARSACGPLGEIHDASMEGGAAALFGFFGIPASVRARVPDDVLRAHCRTQLARLFGSPAALPEADFIKDWSRDAHTATPDDRDGDAGHPTPPAPGAPSGPWHGRLTGIASEWSRAFPGYVAGAVDAAAHGIRLLESFGMQPIDMDNESSLPAPLHLDDKS
ncbi:MULTISPECIES: flavin monoamine oxidase family protein [unclassified Burkholderia]|uniref:flavin monoamine oxidase family protein n=1 Tax=unclassified Burkholderia TaxID=2613784 RepID=UPI001E5EE7AA|nr:MULTISPECIES: FAD-dependent oxidoreductase [unclassified Burkholderia]UEP32874.1 FAD-dependent oxidoreductase [Burkholderia sp. B21-007]UEP46063.1 FAD-dependent oxidoreductase [Burkholderia sp. B21-005]